MVPTSLFTSKRRYVSRVRLPIAEGKVPVKELPVANTAYRIGRAIQPSNEVKAEGRPEYLHTRCKQV